MTNAERLLMVRLIVKFLFHHDMAPIGTRLSALDLVAYVMDYILREQDEIPF